MGLDRFRDAGSPGNQAQVQLEAARLLARQGDLEQARYLLRAAVQLDPACTEAWLQLAWLAQNPVERKMHLQRVVALEPKHGQAHAELGRLERSLAAARPARVRTRGHLNPWALALLGVVSLALLAAVLVWGPVDSSLARLLPAPLPTVTPAPTLTPAQVAAQFFPQLDAALLAEDWDRAMQLVAIVWAVDSTGQEVRQRAEDAHLRYGRFLVQGGEVSQALAHFDQAVLIVPEDTEARTWQEVSQVYLAGSEALAAGDWASAVTSLVRAHEQMPSYGDLGALVIEAYHRQGEAAVKAADWTMAIQALSEARRRAPADARVLDLLATAYGQRGIASQEQGDLEAARSDLEAALALEPDDDALKAHYDEVMYVLFPPKRIEVDISLQRFYAWEGDLLLYEFPTSTGLVGRDTASGHFKVLDKIPMAYSSVWNLDMPYWLGIYYVGNIENGIHALPIRPDGSVMWGGLLGQRASYGCVILSTEAARLIYDWADIGTAVDIHY